MRARKLTTISAQIAGLVNMESVFPRRQLGKDGLYLKSSLLIRESNLAFYTTRIEYSNSGDAHDI
jgi:hypothetical protein